MSNTPSASANAQLVTADCECRARAYAFLVELIGSLPETVTWDSTHRLQGHVHLGCRDLVVIAPRDAAHEPVVVTAPSWDAIRRSPTEQRRELIECCAITDRSGLVSVLESDELALYAPVVRLAA